MFNFTRLVTQPPRHIIEHTSLSSLRVDDSLATNKLMLLSSVVDVWGVNKVGFLRERLPVPTPYESEAMLGINLRFDVGR